MTAVLDNEPLQALADPTHRKHRDVLRLLEAVAQRRTRRADAASVVVPTVVRLEAGVDRHAPASAALGRFRVRDEPLTGARTDRGVVLHAAAGGAPAHVATAQLAEEYADTSTVTIYTADMTDIPRLVSALGVRDVAIRQV